VKSGPQRAPLLSCLGAAWGKAATGGTPLGGLCQDRTGVPCPPLPCHPAPQQAVIPRRRRERRRHTTTHPRSAAPQRSPSAQPLSEAPRPRRARRRACGRAHQRPAGRGSKRPSPQGRWWYAPLGSRLRVGARAGCPQPTEGERGRPRGWCRRPRWELHLPAPSVRFAHALTSKRQCFERSVHLRL